MNEAMNPSTRLARAVVEALLGIGVRQVVLSPGSRNAPLSLALADAARAGALRLHTRIDERTGAFLALGIAKTSRVPVAVLTTSGTAAANLHPAMLEAAHSGIPLVAITADRPARLRGTIANQTTDQVGLFGSAAASADLLAPEDLAAALAGIGTGPVHLNLQFDEPLLPPDRFVPATVPPVREPWVRGTPYRLAQGPRTVVVAGDDAGPGPRVLAEAAGWPLLAEPSSGARNGPNTIRSYRLLLQTELAERIERVVVVGVPTLSRPVQRLLARADVEVVSRPPRGVASRRPHPVALEYDGPFDVAGPDPDPAWLDGWREADRALSGRIDAFVAEQPGLTPYDVAAVVHAAVPPGGLLHVGASNPIRDLDLMAGAYPVGERRLIIANRGLAGIDGTLSTAIGAVLGRPHTTRALLYVGDVTFLHDLTGLLLGPTEERPDLTVVVANDDGGSIFSTLEQGDPAYADGFEKVFGTPHGADLGALCTGLRVPHWRVRDRAELAHALSTPNGGIEVVEAVIGREDRRELDAAIRSLR